MNEWEDIMRIAVIDGQGGGIGKTIVERLRKGLPKEVNIIALGTNALAASLMLKAGADEVASGENAIIFNSSRVDIIVGSIGIIAANSMIGELTPAMAKAIAESSAKKILIPFNRCNIEIIGVVKEPLPNFVERVLESIKNELEV